MSLFSHAELADAPLTVEQEAVRWLLRLENEGLEAAEREEFKTWQAQPACAAAFEKARMLWNAVDQIAETPEIALIRANARRHLTRRAYSVWGLRAASAAVVAVGLGLFAQQYFVSPQATVQNYATVVGQRTASVLPDQSVMTLDTDSAASISYTEGERHVTLNKGRAFFEVAKDASRPFEVVAGAQRIVATGTAFDVRVEPFEVAVTLVEGQVLVDEASASHADASWQARAATLKAGERLVARPNAAILIDTVDAERVISWTRGDLVFEDVRLAEAIAEVNRYSRTNVVLSDARIGNLRVNGVFKAGQAAEFARAVSQVFPVTVHYEPSGTIRLDPSAQPDPLSPTAIPQT
jgi:transmembrane sensor